MLHNLSRPPRLPLGRVHHASSSTGTDCRAETDFCDTEIRRHPKSGFLEQHDALELVKSMCVREVVETLSMEEEITGSEVFMSAVHWTHTLRK